MTLLDDPWDDSSFSKVSMIWCCWDWAESWVEATFPAWIPCWGRISSGDVRFLANIFWVWSGIRDSSLRSTSLSELVYIVYRSLSNPCGLSIATRTLCGTSLGTRENSEKANVSSISSGNGVSLLNRLAIGSSCDGAYSDACVSGDGKLFYSSY